MDKSVDYSETPAHLATNYRQNTMSKHKMKKAINLIPILLLVLMSSSCSRDLRSPIANQKAPDQNAGLSIVFDDSDERGFSNDDRQLISTLIIQADKEVRDLLPTLPAEIEVTVVIISRNVDMVGGVSGRADAPGKVLVELSEVFPGGISAAAQNALSSHIFHEFHHLDRGWTIQDNKFGPGIPTAAVNEGLASVFSEQYTGVYFAEAYSYPEHADEWLSEILALPVHADYSTWMMGEHPDGRNSIGYRVGRYIIHQATANSGKDVLELSKLSPNKILELATAR